MCLQRGRQCWGLLDARARGRREPGRAPPRHAHGDLTSLAPHERLPEIHSICQQIWKTQQWPQDWKRSVFIPVPKKGNAKECSNYRTIALISHANKVMLKILQARLQPYVNRELPDPGYYKQCCDEHWGTRRTPGLAVHHQLPEFTQTHVHRVSDAFGGRRKAVRDRLALQGRTGGVR